MDNLQQIIQTNIYDKCRLKKSNFLIETESREYNACQFQLNGLYIICRTAKTTPTKVGQFVTFWKRKRNDSIEPYHENDLIDFYIVNVQTENNLGQFVFPKSILIQKAIISTDKTEGKRGFRVYPSWDITSNKQAQQTQQWQLDYFYEITENNDLSRVHKLYKA